MVCLAPAFLFKDAAPASLVHVGEGHTLAAFLMGGICVCLGSATNGDKSDLQLFTEALGSDDAGKANCMVCLIVS